MLAFGLFDYIDGPLTYGILSFLCRFIEGAGNGCLNSASSAIIAGEFPDEMSGLIGIH